MSDNDISARFRTLGGATVTVHGRHFEHRAECDACGEWTFRGNLKRWAQDHAHKCNALPR